MDAHDLLLLEVPPPGPWTRQLQQALTPGERARAGRFRRPEDAAAFVATRALLRQHLAQRLGCRAAEVMLAFGAHGKPHQAGVTPAEALEFNVSHSGGMAVLALAPPGQAVGIDIEAVRPVSDALAVARQYFSPAEIGALECLSGHDQQLAFLRCWSRKEAWLKALGAGIGTDLGTFSVEVGPDPSPCPLPDPAGGADWTLYALAVPDGWVAALACRGTWPHPPVLRRVSAVMLADLARDCA